MNRQYSKRILFVLGIITSTWSSLHHSATAMEFTIHGNHSKTLNAIAAKGEIKLNDLNKLHSFLSQLSPKKHTAIYFTSSGGNLFEGMRLGIYFKQNRIKTVIQADEMCASACALAFLGGTDYKNQRWMSTTTTSLLGFHAFRSSKGNNLQSTDQTQKIVAAILEYGNFVKAPIEIFVKSFQTSSDQMYWFSKSEALRLGIKVWDIQKKCFTGNKNCK